jgi:membrane-associated phospholipid phosphatase
MKKIIDLDKWLFLKVNRDCQNPFFDKLMPILRDPLTWVPLYIVLIILVVYNFGKKGWWLIVYGVITVGITDSISSRIFKPLVGRPRPCCDPEFGAQVHLLANCGTGGGFTSAHAANHFGLAMFLFLTLRSFTGNWIYLLFLWAAIICYAQVYVGVHYPFDILAGAIVGCSVAWISATIFTKRNGPLVKLDRKASYA